MTKLLLTCFALFLGFLAIAQPDGGFATNERIDERDNYIKREFSYFVWDKSGSFTQQSYLYNDIDLSSVELLSANLIFTDKDQVQKVVFSPFKLSQSLSAYRLLANTKLNIAVKDKITTVGIGIGGDNSVPSSKKSIRARNAAFGKITSPPSTS